VKPFPLVFAVAALALLIVRRRRLETSSKVVLLVLAAALGVYGTGLVHLPNLETLLEDAGTRLGKWTYLLVGVMAFAETGAFLGFVAPGEFTVLLGGLVAGQGKIQVIPLLALVWACAVAGDVTSFLLGRRLGREFLVKHGAKVKITEERLGQVEAFFERRGGATILVGRFLGLVRPIAPFLAGSTRMPLRRFLPYDIVAAGLWSTTFVLIGYLFWHSFDKVVQIAHQGAFALGGTATVVVGGYVTYRQLREEENRERVAAWIDEQAQRPVIGPFARLLQFLWRVCVRPVLRLLEGPARFFWQRLTPGELGLELTTLAAVVAVGAFTFVGYTIVLADIPTTVGDGRAFDLASRLRTDVGVDVAKVVTWLGSLSFVGPVVGLTGLWLAIRGRAVEAVTLIVGMTLTVVAVHVAKAAVDRPRPSGGLTGTDGMSFPSGHAAYAVGLVAVAVALSRTAPALRAVGLVGIAVVVAALVGATRVYLRAHYLSDVLGGFGLAAAIFGLCGTIAVIVAFVRHNDPETT
jgi:undecaprenyl-diphosphatase